MTPKILAEPNNLRWLVPAAAAIALPYFTSLILVFFLFAAVLACISSPLVSWPARHRVRREPGTLLVGLRHPGSRRLNRSMYKE